MKILQWTYIFILLIVSFSASLFIILESGEFYQQLYPQKAGGFPMGYWAAGLNEIFMAIMAAVWIPNTEQKQKNNEIHIMNLLFKILLVLLFLTTIGGASFQITQKTMSEIQKQKNNQKIVSLLKTQIEDNSKSLDIFTAQNQRINSVLSVRRQDKTKDELKELIRDNKIDFMLWIQLIFLVLLRFVIQLANLCCVWLAGWTYRNKDFGTVKTTGHRTEPRNTKNQKIALIKTRYQSGEHRLNTIRNEIIQMINTRNTGVSLQDVGYAIKESSETLEKIVNTKFKLENQHLSKLAQILDKLKKIYQQEKVSSY